MIHGRSWPTFLLAATLTLLAADAPDAKRPAPSTPLAIRWNRSGTSALTSVDVLGIDPANLAVLAQDPGEPEQWIKLFSVTVRPSGKDPEENALPILGTYRVTEGVLRFQPRFPLDDGLSLRARFRPSRLPHPDARPPADITADETLAARTTTAPPSSLTRVDPSSDHPPENLLKFYLHFSQPMARGEAYRRVRLIGEDGQALERPFLEIGEELWDPSGTRLTLLLDPGRIKRGLRPRLEEGPILLEGKAYTLVVDRDWADAWGRPLREGFRKSFRAGPTDERQPDPKTWKREVPAAGSRDALGLRFPEPLDRAMLERVFAVQNASGAEVAGRITIDQQDTRWQFIPEKPWAAGTYRVTFANELEDLAGNSIARPFEVDILRPVEPDANHSTSSVISVIIPTPDPRRPPSPTGKVLDADGQQLRKK